MNYYIVGLIIGVLIFLYAAIDYQLGKAFVSAALGSEIKKEDNELFFWLIVLLKTFLGLYLIVLSIYKWAISG